MKIKIENLISITEIVPMIDTNEKVCSCCGNESIKHHLTFYEAKNEYFCRQCSADGSASRHILFNFNGTVADFTDTLKSLNMVL